jgi:hypothetical protein
MFLHVDAQVFQHHLLKKILLSIKKKRKDDEDISKAKISKLKAAQHNYPLKI